MYNNPLNLFKSVESLPPYVNKANKLLVTGAEKVSALQLAALKFYSDAALGQFKAAWEIRDLESMQAFCTSQMEQFQALRLQALDAAKALIELEAEYRAEFEKLIKESTADIESRPGVRKAA